MKKIVFLITAAFVFATGFAQKTIHDPNVEVRNVSGFHAVEVSGGINLYLSSGDDAVVAVSAADKEVRDHIVTEVKNGVLKIYFDWKKGFRFSLHGKSIKAYVSCKSLEALSASGGSDIMVDGTISSDKLSLSLSGGSDFNGKVAVGSLTINQSGGSDVHMSGSANSISIEASGGSDFGGYGLIADTCTISASGGSDVNITVNKEISAKASGASDVSWKGSAAVKKVNASGAGSVSHKS